MPIQARTLNFGMRVQGDLEPQPAVITSSITWPAPMPQPGGRIQQRVCS